MLRLTRDHIVEMADELGTTPRDLATVISYETGGTFNPLKKGPTTQWGQHRGLLQFGEPQAQQYGVDWDDPLNSQVGRSGAIVSYLKANGFRPGMGLLDLYSTINAGAPGLYNRSDANNGGAPGSVADKVNNQMAGHMRNADKLLGADGSDTLSGNSGSDDLSSGAEFVPTQRPDGTWVVPEGLSSGYTPRAYGPSTLGDKATPDEPVRTDQDRRRQLGAAIGNLFGSLSGNSDIASNGQRLVDDLDIRFESDMDAYEAKAEAVEEINETAQHLRNMGRGDLADAIVSGALDGAQAYDRAMRDAERDRGEAQAHAQDGNYGRLLEANGHGDLAQLVSQGMMSPERAMQEMMSRRGETDAIDARDEERGRVADALEAQGMTQQADAIRTGAATLEQGRAWLGSGLDPALQREEGRVRAEAQSELLAEQEAANTLDAQYAQLADRADALGLTDLANAAQSRTMDVDDIAKALNDAADPTPVVDDFYSRSNAETLSEAAGTLRAMENIIASPPSVTGDVQLVALTVRTAQPGLSVSDAEQVANDPSLWPEWLKRLTTDDGRLTPDGRQGLLRVAFEIYRGQETTYDQARADTEARLARLGVSADDASTLLGQHRYVPPMPDSVREMEPDMTDREWADLYHSMTPQQRDRLYRDRWSAGEAPQATVSVPKSIPEVPDETVQAARAAREQALQTMLNMIDMGSSEFTRDEFLAMSPKDQVRAMRQAGAF